VLTGRIDDTMTGRSVTVAGLVNFVRHHITKKGDAMAFAQIEDLQGPLELVIFPSVWEQTRELWEPERVLLVRGRVSFRGRDPSLLVESATNEILTAEPREGGSETVPESVDSYHIHIGLPRTHDLEEVITRLGRIYELLKSFQGHDHFSLYVENGGKGRVQIDFPNDSTGYCQDLENKLRELVGSGTLEIEQVGGNHESR
jgi:DNA polymerase-3 subunit alpha